MEKPIRVRILNREYPLRVRPEDEEPMRRLAAALHERMTAFKKAHPEQPDVVAAVMTALAYAEAAEGAHRDVPPDLIAQLDALSAELTHALADQNGTDQNGVKR